MEKHKHSKINGFLNISRGWVNSHSTGKVWEKNIPKSWVPKYFMWSRNPNNFQTTEWVNSHITEKIWENTGNSQVLLYLTDLELVGTHANPNVRECANSYNMEIFLWKAISLPGCEFLRKLELTRKPKPSPKYESSKISCYGNTIAKTTLFPYYGLWLKINRVRQPIKFPDMGNYNPGQNIWNKIE